jgi:hypothetical protein
MALYTDEIVPQCLGPCLDPSLGWRHFEAHVASDASFLDISDMMLSALAAQQMCRVVNESLHMLR